MRYSQEEDTSPETDSVEYEEISVDEDESSFEEETIFDDDDGEEDFSIEEVIEEHVVEEDEETFYEEEVILDEDDHQAAQACEEAKDMNRIKEGLELAKALEERAFEKYESLEYEEATAMYLKLLRFLLGYIDGDHPFVAKVYFQLGREGKLRRSFATVPDIPSDWLKKL